MNCAQQLLRIGWIEFFAGELAKRCMYFPDGNRDALLLGSEWVVRPIELLSKEVLKEADLLRTEAVFSERRKDKEDLVAEVIDNPAKSTDFLRIAVTDEQDACMKG